MRGLPSDLHRRCRDTLLRCSEFDSNAVLRAVFVTDELYFFHDRLPTAATKSERVDACLDFLLDKHLSDGRPVLPLFLAALRDKYSPGDALRDELGGLAETVWSVLVSEPPPSPKPSPALEPQPPPPKPTPPLSPPRIPAIAWVMVTLLLLDFALSLVLLWRFIGGRPDLLSYIEAVTGLIGVLLQVVLLFVAFRVREMSSRDLLIALGTRRWLHAGIIVMTIILMVLMFRDVDGPSMVRVPAGKFWMGSNAYASDPDIDEVPEHEVYLDTFWIDLTEVTNAQYKRCVEAGACSSPQELSSATRESYYDNPAFDKYPVIYVNWEQAAAYCEWVGARLPTEAEWEYSARGPDSLVFPWGKEFDGAKLNYCDTNCEVDWIDWSDKTTDDGYADTAPVGSYPDGASWCGALDMSGNVWEWVADWYGQDYPSELLSINPQGPSSGEFRIIRGGAWDFSQQYVRATARLKPHPLNIDDGVGFRCARSDSEPPATSTPWPAPTVTPVLVSPTPVLTPSFAILSPSEGEEASVRTRVHGTATGLPDDHQLWMLVQRGEVPGYYPQSGPIEIGADGSWETPARLGSNSDVDWHKTFTITVVLADTELGQEFSNFLDEWPADTGLALPEDVLVLDRVRVIRSDPIVILNSHALGARVVGRETLSGRYENLDPGNWHLYGIVVTEDDRFVPYGPFEPEASVGVWIVEVEFPWPADGSREVSFHTLAVLSGTNADEILQSAAGSLLSADDLSDGDWSDVYGPLAQTTLTRADRIAFASDRPGNDDIFVINVDGSNLMRLTTDPARDTDPAWSPDATQIVFASSREETTQLYVMDADGQNLRRVITGSVVPGRAPNWSPNGEWIAFHSEQGDNTDIYRVRADGMDLVRLTDAPERDLYPVWSPDGEQIIFFSERAEDDADCSELYVMDADGGNVTRLTHNEVAEGYATWSPDGGQIIFISDVDDKRDVYLMNADGSNVTWLADVDYDRHPVFAPDGHRFVFDSSANNRQMFLATVDGNEPIQIQTGLAKGWWPMWSPVSDDERIVFVGRFDGDWEIYTMWDDGADQLRLMENDSNEVQPRVSPNGRLVAFASDVTGDYEIWLEDARTPAPWIRLTDNTANDRRPAWSPDGQKLAFTSDRDGDWDIYVMNANGTGVVQLTDDPAEDSFPAWSPDGQQIVFYSSRSGDGDVYVMNAADGANARPLVENPGFDWCPAWSPDGRTLAFASARDYSGTYATELYALDLLSGDLRRLTSWEGHDGIPLWSSDGQRIYFTSDRLWGIDDIWVMDADGSNARNLTEDDRSDVFGGP